MSLGVKHEYIDYARDFSLLSYMRRIHKRAGINTISS
jgi:hypothetical protein